MNIVIFSKNRACQLDLLLRSIKRLWLDHDAIDIIWKATNYEFNLAYKKLIGIHGSEFNFIEQGNSFKNDVISIMSFSNNYSMFLVDDLVFKEQFTINCKEFNLFKDYNDTMALSLRLDKNTNYCYTQNKMMEIPIIGEENIWFWEDADLDWGYPWSIDGSIFYTKDIKNVILNSNYSSPNKLETNLINGMDRKYYMICFDKAKVINNPVNKVGKYNNRHGEITIEYLNEKYLSGNRISLDPIIGMQSNSCHKEFEYIYENEIN